jgi:hypothetical protein
MPIFLMNTDKATKLLKKIQALYDNLGDQGSMSSLERDLILSYLRELYEEFSTATPGATTHKRVVEPQVVIPQAVEPKPAPQVAPVIQYTPPPPAPTPPPPPPVPEPIAIKEEPSPIRYEEEFKPATVISPTPIKQEHHNPVAIPSPVEVMTELSPDVDAGVAALFEFKQSGELSEKLKMQPIERVEQGMGINERVLMINELFSGDGDSFRKTLAHINELPSFSAARDYLVNDIAARYKWSEGHKKDAAMVFVQLVRRKFLNT